MIDGVTVRRQSRRILIVLSAPRYSGAARRTTTPACAFLELTRSLVRRLTLLAPAARQARSERLPESPPALDQGLKRSPVPGVVALKISPSAAAVLANEFRRHWIYASLVLSSLA